MDKKTKYLLIILNFLMGICAVIVMIVILHQRSKINTLRRELASCSSIRHNCIDQLGVFYVDPYKKLATRGKNDG